VNMDWQHLLMNGENLGEYVALLDSEGLLGHQHANSGWGTFDDDNMVGATAFMETVELALELRRAGYGRNGDERRLGFDLYPYTEDQVGAVRRSVLQWRFIDETAGRIDAAALEEAQDRKDAIRAYELVYEALGAR
jgi:xylose isomerase